MDIKTIRHINFAEMVRLAGTKAKLARKANMKPNYLSHPALGSRFCRKLEKALGLAPGWMDLVHSQGDDGGAQKIGVRGRKLRLISWAQAWSFKGMVFLDSAEKDATFIYADASDVGEGSFALRVRGESMVNSEGVPSFPDGCIITVDPTVEPMPDDNVVVKLPTAEEAVFKKLELFDGELYLKPLNSHYPMARMPEGAKIIGVVVGVQTAIQPRSRRTPASAPSTGNVITFPSPK
jgi:hypothetical protein